MDYKIKYINRKSYFDIIIICHFININKVFVCLNIYLNQSLKIELKIKI